MNNEQNSHPLLPSFSINTYDFEARPNLVIPWHLHEEVEFLYIASGNALITVEEKTVTAVTGDYILINQNVHHFITPPDRKLILQCIKFQPSMLLGIGQLELEKEYILPVIHNSHFEYIQLTSDNEHYDSLHQYYHAIYALEDKMSCHSDLAILANCLQLWNNLYGICLTPSHNAIEHINIQDEQRVKAAILYIQEHYMESITLDDIADSIMVSKSECCRCFKRVMHSTPFEYLLEYRIIESTKRMKRKRQESISQIAGSVGFNNTSYFNKIFKKTMHCTPTEYRKNLQS